MSHGSRVPSGHWSLFIPMVAVLVFGYLAVGGGRSVASTALEAADTSSHLASTWDAPDSRIGIRDPSALSADVKADTVRSTSDNPLCDLYTTTFTLTWVAEPGRVLKSVVTEDDGFGYSWRRIDGTSWTMTPSGEVLDAKSPVVRTWYLKGTHRSDPSVCPRDTRTLNHVEIYVDGDATNMGGRPIVHVPPRSHLAAVWRWPGDVEVIDPARVEVTQHVYTETETPVGPCEAHLTELDLDVRGIGAARIVAVGSGSPGEDVTYQNGDTDAVSRGVVAHEWFLTGTDTKSALCPPDSYTEDLLEFYTDAGRRG